VRSAPNHHPCDPYRKYGNETPLSSQEDFLKFIVTFLNNRPLLIQGHNLEFIFVNNFQGFRKQSAYHEIMITQDTYEWFHFPYWNDCCFLPPTR
jgi:hypothetical protein